MKLVSAWNLRNNLKSTYDRKGIIPPLDGLRACAALYVIIFHYSMFWSRFNANTSEDDK